MAESGSNDLQLLQSSKAEQKACDAERFETSSESDSAISLSYKPNATASRHCSGTFASNNSKNNSTRPASANSQPASGGGGGGGGGGGNRFHILDRQQVCRLCQVMEREVCINARCRDSTQLPTIKFTLRQFLRKIREKLQRSKIRTSNVRLNGGAATYVIFDADYTKAYHDVDLIFDVSVADESVLEEAKRIVFETLFEFMPKEQQDSASAEPCDAGSSSSNSNYWSYQSALKDSYVKKMIKILNENDRWSLISLSNDDGRNLELKFVERTRRQYEFTVDSFHIILDSLLRFYDSGRQMTEHYYPTIAAESVYGNFGSALEHLRSRTIFTRNPEEIRGGGLLRYCRLLCEGYCCSADLADVQSMQQLMCSRFFIDFSSLAEQESKLRSYLDSHFPGEHSKLAKHRYLVILYQVVAQNTICLMAQEMQQILSLIFYMAHQVLLEIQRDEMLKCIQNNLASLHLNTSVQPFNCPSATDKLAQLHATAPVPAQMHAQMCFPQPVHANLLAFQQVHADLQAKSQAEYTEHHAAVHNGAGCLPRPANRANSTSSPTLRVHHMNAYGGYGSPALIPAQEIGPGTQACFYDNKTGCSNRLSGRKVFAARCDGQSPCVPVCAHSQPQTQHCNSLCLFPGGFHPPHNRVRSCTNT